MTSVAFLIDQLFAVAPGGIGTYTRELVAALVRADPALDVTLFHSRFGHGIPEAWAAPHRVVELPVGIRRLYPSWALLGRPRLPPELRSPELVHTPLPAAVPPVGDGQRLIVTVHDLAFLVHPEIFPARWRLLYGRALRRAVRTADAVIAPSRHTAGDLVRLAGLSASKVHVVPLAARLPNGRRDEEKVLARLKVRPPYLLFVGTVEPRKNVVRLMRAYRRLAAGGAAHRLVLAGPVGWRRDDVLREAARDGPGDVVLVGELDPAELDALYRAADAFVYPSLYEGFGLPVLEAMARGVPCVVSRSSSLTEVAGDAALLVDPLSEAELAEALARVTGDPGLRARLRESGPERASRYTWDATARGTLRVYDSVLGRA